jgi:hypoxanthine-DNA glycosylase
MPRIHSFPLVSDPQAHLLILGSMPGKASLQRQQYYAHPQNVFWKIMGTLVGAHPTLPYAARLQCLKDSGIALWDVLYSCERTSSLDSDIAQERANDFATFFAQHPDITRVCFNGTKAEQSFRKFVTGQQPLPPLQFARLPSTSPAHAGMSFADKLQVWQQVVLATRRP